MPVSATGFPQAVAALKQWADKGYFTNDFAGVAADAAQDFVDGKGLFHFDYSGSLPLSAGQAKDFGSFILPRNDGSARSRPCRRPPTSRSPRSPSTPPPRRRSSTSPRARGRADRRADLGTNPMLAPEREGCRPSNPLFADDVANANAVTTHDASVPYLDWATPTLFNTINVHDAGNARPARPAAASRRPVQNDDAVPRRWRK